jgi:hypothetical protein
MATNTFWGIAQETRRIAPGIIWYSTASHGGYAVSATLAATMRPHLYEIGVMRWTRLWFEEDCAWAAVVTQWPELFSEADRKAADGTLGNWYPDAWEAEYGRKLTASESIVIADREFAAATREKLVARAAWGDWHEKVPEGYVGVCGYRASDGTEAWKLLPAAEYHGGRTVIDKYSEWVNHA